ncbi:hypothetical protein Sango_2461000 [Sesamum angolense]|uniref:DUF4216 domain-containing protein n=1 Tax=Sesamum angolense TaxID=2727404 RepID=A0AAE1W8E8_9LAMI|nr:hypothetical protein Sango_2461000 [Sesamum angolense]
MEGLEDHLYRSELEDDERRSNVIQRRIYRDQGTEEEDRGEPSIPNSMFDDARCQQVLMGGPVQYSADVKSDLNYTDNELLKLHYWVPTTKVPTFTCYLVNGYNFHTGRHSVGKSTMSYRVCVKNSSYTDTNSDFYGILEEIIQLDYPLIPNMHIILFKCRWVDPVRGMKVHPCYQLVDANFKKVYQKNETFILEQQAVQVYYTEYPIMKRNKGDWMTICKTKARRVIDDSRWTEVAFQEDKTIPSPQVVTDNHNYELHGPNYIQLVVELSIANQQGASTSGSAQCESGDKSDKDNFDENYETEEDNNYD